MPVSGWLAGWLEGGWMARACANHRPIVLLRRTLCPASAAAMVAHCCAVLWLRCAALCCRQRVREVLVCYCVLLDSQKAMTGEGACSLHLVCHTGWLAG